MTLACEDANSNLVEVVTIADVDLMLRIMLADLGAVLKLNFCSEFEHKGFEIEAQARF